MKRALGQVGRIVVGTLLGTVSACFFVALHQDGARASDSVTTPAQRETYTQSVRQHYNLRFGQDKPFLPSNATTDTGQFISPKAFPTAKYCSHCHQEAHTEWRESAHANSFRAPWYIKNTALLTFGSADKRLPNQSQVR